MLSDQPVGFASRAGQPPPQASPTSPSAALFSNTMGGAAYGARLLDHGEIYASKTFRTSDGRAVWWGWTYESSLGCTEMCGDGTSFTAAMVRRRAARTAFNSHLRTCAAGVLSAGAGKAGGALQRCRQLACWVLSPAAAAPDAASAFPPACLPACLPAGLAGRADPAPRNNVRPGNHVAPAQPGQGGGGAAAEPAV